MSEELNVIPSVIIMRNLMHLVRVAMDDRGKHTCSCCAIFRNL